MADGVASGVGRAPSNRAGAHAQPGAAASTLRSPMRDSTAGATVCGCADAVCPCLGAASAGGAAGAPCAPGTHAVYQRGCHADAHRVEVEPAAVAPHDRATDRDRTGRRKHNVERLGGLVRGV